MGQRFLNQTFTNPANNPFARFLNAGPAAQNSTFLRNSLGGLMADMGLGAWNQFEQSSSPIFNRNLNIGLGALNAAAPAANASAFGAQGIDLARQAIEDYNMFTQQSRLNFMAPALQAAGLLNQASASAAEENIQSFFAPTTSLANTILAGGFQPGLSEVVQKGGFLDFATQGLLGLGGIGAGFPNLFPGIGRALSSFFGGGGGGNDTFGTTTFSGGNMFGVGLSPQRRKE